MAAGTAASSRACSSGSIARIAAVNFYNPDRQPQLADETTVDFVAVTTGGFSAIDIWLDDISGDARIGVIGTAGVSMFPFILPSSIQPQASLTVWDASSSHMILFIMLVASIIFIPIILAYTSWVYSVMRGKVTEEEIEEGGGHAY